MRKGFSLGQWDRAATDAAAVVTVDQTAGVYLCHTCTKDSPNP